MQKKKLIYLPVFVSFVSLIAGQASAAGPQIIYTDSLNSSWQNWSWNTEVYLNSTDQVQSGSNSMYFSPQAWGGLYLHSSSPFLTQTYNKLDFSLFSFTGNLDFYVLFYGDNDSPLKTVQLSDYGGKTKGFAWVDYSLPIKDIVGATNITGFALQESSGMHKPAFYLDNISLQQSVSEPTPPVSPTPPQQPNPPAQQPIPVVSGGYSQQNGKLYYNSQPIQLKGVSWFGFETGTHSPHGLWARNMEEMVNQMKQVGFNAVRVPFCPPTLDGVPVGGVDTSLNPKLAGMNSLQLLDTVLQELNNKGMYILLDHHTIDCQTIPDLWHSGNYSTEEWLNDLKFVADRYKNLSYFMGIDIKNEPHGSATWGTGNEWTDWKIAAEKAGQAVLSVNNNLLIFVQGVQDNPVCSNNSNGHWMGGNLEPRACYAIDKNKIPANKLVFSPHVYGPDVYVQGYFNSGNYPWNLEAIWNQHFGYLANQGYAIVPGEWGGKYGEGDARDKVWQDTIANYFKQKGIVNSFYWSWNPNSGDTGGILRDDWRTVRTDKLEMLNRLWN